MTTPLLPSSQIRDPGDLIAAVPHLIGFHPADSLVVVLLEGRSIAVTLRVDLPDPRNDKRTAEHLKTPAGRHPDSQAVALVIGGGRGDPPESLPRGDLVAHLRTALRTVGVPLSCAVWTPATAKGAPWFDYDDRGHEGTVPDPQVTALAATSAALGFVTYENRAAMAEILTPDDRRALLRRSAKLDRLAEQSDHDQARHRELVQAEVARANTRKRPLTDDEVVDLSYALSDLWVRDACLAYAVGEHAAAAERLWTELTRAAPPPERAEPATLLAFSAYIRGDGALASMALERADEALPGHRLAALLRMALDTGLPPTEIRSLAEQTAAANWLDQPQPEEDHD
jgi:Domain of unknown function (DUF4192)